MVGRGKAQHGFKVLAFEYVARGRAQSDRELFPQMVQRDQFVLAPPAFRARLATGVERSVASSLAPDAFLLDLNGLYERIEIDLIEKHLRRTKHLV
jgi:hypothetical protein